MRERLFLISVAVASFVTMPGCGGAQDCRPGTLFLHVDVGADVQDADALEVTVKRSGAADATLPDFMRSPGAKTESIELTFTNYVPQQQVTVDVAAKHQGKTIGSGSKTLNLLTVCTATEFAVTAATPDGGVDLSMQDLTVPLPDLTGYDGPPLDFSRYDLEPPPGFPGAPGNVVATALVGGKFQITWTAPASDGGSPITGYAIDSAPAGVAASSSTLSYTTPSLTLGSNYVFSVRATNAAGSGPPGSSASVTCADVPSAPTMVVATAPSGRGVVNWMPSNPNGSAIMNYTVTLNPGSQTQVLGSLATSATFTGLTNGSGYTFTVYATNAFGNGPSATSNAITANCTNNTYTLYAIDTCSVNYGTPTQTSVDANMEATRDPRVFNVDLRGWAKFSLATMPSWAVIKTIHLNLYAGQVNVGSTPTPTLEIWYSQDDGWTRAAIPQPADIHPTMVVTPTYPSGNTGYQGFDINVPLRDWSGDVLDHYITLGIRNTNTNWSSNVYYSSDNNPAGTAPFVVIGTCE